MESWLYIDIFKQEHHQRARMTTIVLAKIAFESDEFDYYPN